ncbi:MAG: hypothetical protein WC933_02740 [Candidatus Paceibacterota bacterium]|jgi:hypothetical protein
MNKNEINKRLSWFSKEGNEVLKKDGFIYFKHWDGNYKRWTVSKFTNDSWNRMHRASNRKEMEQASKELEEKYFID